MKLRVVEEHLDNSCKCQVSAAMEFSSGRSAARTDQRLSFAIEECVHFDQRQIVFGSMLCCLFELKNLRGIAFVTYDCLFAVMLPLPVTHAVWLDSFLADREANADGLNPLIISHTANTISCKAMGRNRMSRLMSRNCSI